MLVRQSKALWLAAGLGLLLAATSGPGLANIDLVFEAVPESPCADYLEIALYAVSDDPNAGQGFTALDVILGWDPNNLRLDGYNEEFPYPYSWPLAGFPAPGPEDLNVSFDDGDAIFTAWANLGDPAVATPEGLLVTRFVFEKLNGGALTTIEMIDFVGETATVVYGTIGGLAVTGTLDTIDVIPINPGDLNCDGVVNLADIDPFVIALDDQANYEALYPNCNWLNADTNCDGLVDLQDIDALVELLDSR